MRFFTYSRYNLIVNVTCVKRISKNMIIIINLFVLWLVFSILKMQINFMTYFPNWYKVILMITRQVVDIWFTILPHFFLSMMNSKENTNSNSSKFGEESENIDEDIPSIHLVCVLVANFNFSISNFLETFIYVTRLLFQIISSNYLIGWETYGWACVACKGFQ